MSLEIEGKRKKVMEMGWHKLVRYILVMSIMSTMGTAAGAVGQDVSSASESPEEIITLKIEGWTCASCEKGIRRALEAVPGVKRAEVSYARGGAVVEVEPGRVSGDQLVHAVAGAGTILSSYRATVVPNGTLTASDGGTSRLGSWLEGLFR